MENTSISTPTVYGGTNIDSNATVCSSQTGDKFVELSSEQIFDKKYKIVSRIGRKSSQAKVYLAESLEESDQVVIKLYDSAFKPDYDMIDKFMKLDSPYLAKLLSYGVANGSYYEVYKYYKNGNILDKMNGTPLSSEYVEKIAIASLNEALNALHNIGIVHADVKPENILIGDDEQSLVLSDYGISVQLNKKGSTFKQIQGTLAYAPMTIGHFGSIKISKAWDYGSLGLVLITLLCGQGLFEGIDEEEIPQLWENGIEIPSIITGRMRELIVGLLKVDENERFGYDEIDRWCKGEIVKKAFNRKIAVEKEIQPLIVAIVDGKVISVKSPVEFAQEALKNWDAARVRIFENPTSKSVVKNFLMQFNKETYDSVKSYLDYIDKDKTLFCVAYTLHPLKDIYYKGRYLGKLEQLFSDDNLVSNADELLAFVKSDLLEFYLDINEYEKEVMDSIKALVDIAGNDGKFLYYLLMYSFSKEKVLTIHQYSIRNIDELSNAVVAMGVDKILSEEYQAELYAWLYCMGYGNEVNLMRKRDNNEQ